MKIGFQVPQFGGFASVETLERAAREIEAHGFDSVWAGDHIVIPTPYGERFGSVFFEIFTTLAFLAAITTRVRLGTSVVLVPYRPPLVLAKMIASLDALSRGRTIIGVAPGWMQEEFEALEIPFGGRGAQTDRALRTMYEAWSNGRAGQAACEPRPVQQPRPPIWIGGNGPRSRQRAVEMADGWHPITSARVGITLDELARGIADLRERAERAGRDPDELEVALRAPLSFSLRDDGQYLGFMGDVGEIRERVQQCREIGVGHLVLDTFYSIPGGVRAMRIDDFLSTVERFASEVGTEL